MPADNTDYRLMYFAGFTGTFSPQATVNLLMINNPAPAPVPAGPHGGVAQCYQQDLLMHCVWATTTTVGEFWFFDGNDTPTGTLLNKHISANFAKIRDVLEVAG